LTKSKEQEPSFSKNPLNFIVNEYVFKNILNNLVIGKGLFGYRRTASRAHLPPCVRLVNNRNN
jgi:hypothetical protein